MELGRRMSCLSEDQEEDRNPLLLPPGAGPSASGPSASGSSASGSASASPEWLPGHEKLVSERLHLDWVREIVGYLAYLSTSNFREWANLVLF